MSLKYAYTEAVDAARALKLAVARYKPEQYDGWGAMRVCLAIGDPFADTSRLFTFSLASSPELTDCYALAVFHPTRRRVYFVGFCDWWGVTVRKLIKCRVVGKLLHPVTASVPRGCFKPELRQWYKRAPARTALTTVELDWYISRVQQAGAGHDLTVDEQRKLGRLRLAMLHQRHGAESALLECKLQSSQVESADVESFVLLRHEMCTTAPQHVYEDWCNAEVQWLRRRLYTRVRNAPADLAWLLLHVHPRARVANGLTRPQLAHIGMLQPPIASAPPESLPLKMQQSQHVLQHNASVLFSLQRWLPCLVDWIVAKFRRLLDTDRAALYVDQPKRFTGLQRHVLRRHTKLVLVNADHRLNLQQWQQDAEVDDDGVDDTDIVWQPAAAAVAATAAVAVT